MARELEAKLSIDGAEVARVVRFDAIHDAGRPTLLEAEVVLDDFADLEQFVAKEASLSLGAVGEEPRMFFGVVEAATVIGSTEHGTDVRGTRYVVRIVSRLA